MMNANTSKQLVLSILACLLCLTPVPAARAQDVPASTPSLMVVTQGAAGEEGTPLTLKALEDLTLTVKELFWNPKSESMDTESVKLTRKLAAGESYSFTFLPAGDIPNLALCAKPQSGEELCWTPSFSGEDGHLEMDPGFVLESPALVEVAHAPAPEGETSFSLKAKVPLTLSLKDMAFDEKRGDIAPVRIREARHLEAGETYTFSHLVSEGIPDLSVCAQAESGPETELCWTPFFSGEDGHLMLGPGFVPQK